MERQGRRPEYIPRIVQAVGGLTVLEIHGAQDNLLALFLSGFQVVVDGYTRKTMAVVPLAAALELVFAAAETTSSADAAVSL